MTEDLTPVSLREKKGEEEKATALRSREIKSSERHLHSQAVTLLRNLVLVPELL